MWLETAAAAAAPTVEAHHEGVRRKRSNESDSGSLSTKIILPDSNSWGKNVCVNKRSLARRS